MEDEIPRYGFVRTEEDGWVSVPEFLLDEEFILWPPVLPEIEPGEPTPFMSETDYYWRHQMTVSDHPAGEVFVFVKSKSRPEVSIDQIIAFQSGEHHQP